MLPKKLQNRVARKRRIRAKVRGTARRPRLNVYRSLRNLSVQLVDDDAGKTVVAASLRDIKDATLTVEGAAKLGAEIAKRAQAQKIESIVFDRNAYTYHGRVRALADAVREGGVMF